MSRLTLCLGCALSWHFLTWECKKKKKKSMQLNCIVLHVGFFFLLHDFHPKPNLKHILPNMSSTHHFLEIIIFIIWNSSINYKRYPSLLSTLLTKVFCFLCHQITWLLWRGQNQVACLPVGPPPHSLHLLPCQLSTKTEHSSGDTCGIHSMLQSHTHLHYN